MPAEAAVAAPRAHHQWQPNVLLVEPGVGAPAREALAHLGHEIREIPEVAAVSLATALPGAEAAGAGDARKGGAARSRSGDDPEGDEWHDGAPANLAEHPRVPAQP
jgi:gamma-glutamyltranspeptidase